MPIVIAGFAGIKPQSGAGATLAQKMCIRDREDTIVERNLRKTRVGKVVSDKMDKTIVVAVVDLSLIHIFRLLYFRLVLAMLHR